MIAAPKNDVAVHSIEWRQRMSFDLLCLHSFEMASPKNKKN